MCITHPISKKRTLMAVVRVVDPDWIQRLRKAGSGLFGFQTSEELEHFEVLKV